VLNASPAFHKQVGTIAVKETSEGAAELLRMYVDRGVRGRGIAKRLVQVWQCVEVRFS
jgi:GNAT superfamily N-acetyltransferase